MMQGLLEIRGAIDLGQFWPAGESDADTTKIELTVGPGAFRFRPHPGAAFTVTRAFEGARVRGRVTRAVIDAKRRVVIRLQGVDAPELHYTPQALVAPADRTAQQDTLYREWNHKYRQPLGESATVALHALLAGAGKDPLPCRAVTAVDAPDDAVDAYGRVVADIVVRIGGRGIDVNTWLAKNGWAVPTFYNSMSPDEIGVIARAAREARAGKRGVWPHLAKAVGTLDFDLRYRKSAPPGRRDSGPVLAPKLFRRLCAWAVNRRARMVTGGFAAYLGAHPDPCYLTDDFLDQGPFAATPRRLEQFVGPQGRLLARPEDLVFHEAPARLVGPTGKTPRW